MSLGDQRQKNQASADERARNTPRSHLREPLNIGLRRPNGWPGSFSGTRSATRAHSKSLLPEGHHFLSGELLLLVCKMKRVN